MWKSLGATLRAAAMTRLSGRHCSIAVRVVVEGTEEYGSVDALSIALHGATHRLRRPYF